jgi:hypothetical protein
MKLLKRVSNLSLSGPVLEVLGPKMMQRFPLTPDEGVREAQTNLPGGMTR